VPSPTVAAARVPIIPPPRGKDVGGHAFAFVGYTPEGFIVQNSWGTRWGYYGFAILPYADWLAHSTDAWVCALGVPAAQTETIERAAHHFVSGQTRRGEPAADLAGAPPSLVSKTFDPREYFEPLSIGEAYERTLVLGNDGIPEQRLVAYANASSSATYVCAERPRQWFAKRGTAARKLVVYAHGGLNDELDSIDRIRVLSPYFEANGCLPLFLTWHTGFLDTVVDLIRERLDEFLGAALPQQGYWDNLRRGLQTAKNVLTERTDRALEVGLRSAGGKAMWSEMKDNAAGGASADGGLRLMADALTSLAAEPAGCEIHLVGHSAGSIVHGHLLRLLAERGVRVASCHLLAPACTVEFAVAHYAAACNAGQLAREHLHIHTLSDVRETADTVGGIYRKSLLYLVSRAFEAAHKTPILGLLKAFDPACNTPEHWNEQDLRGPADHERPARLAAILLGRGFDALGIRGPRTKPGADAACRGHARCLRRAAQRSGEPRQLRQRCADHAQRDCRDRRRGPAAGTHGVESGVLNARGAARPARRANRPGVSADARDAFRVGRGRRPAYGPRRHGRSIAPA